MIRKGRKCKISEEYNAKRGSEPSKFIDFRIDFSSKFHAFSKPPSGDHFQRVQVPTDAQKRDIGPIFALPGVPKSTHGATFSVKKVDLFADTVFRERPWSRPGRDLAPKTVQNRLMGDDDY